MSNISSLQIEGITRLIINISTHAFQSLLWMQVILTILRILIFQFKTKNKMEVCTLAVGLTRYNCAQSQLRPQYGLPVEHGRRHE